MPAMDALARGRQSFERRAWAAAYAELAVADRDQQLDPADLHRLAVAAHSIGKDLDSVTVWQRAHLKLLRAGDVRGAARCAFWLAFTLLNDGAVAQGGGWLARARRLLADQPADCVEVGYLLLPTAIEHVIANDYASACAVAAEAAAIGDRFDDQDLSALARQVHGRALIRRGKPADGMALLDEAMVAVLADEVSVLVAGSVYCGVIEACRETYDLRRAREWTEALARWCDAQPDLIAYRGECQLHRAEVLQLAGAWSEALDAARSSCERLHRVPGRPPAGAAWYRRAELHRLRGDLAAAEDGYRRASRLGHEPLPGLALLRLAQGDVDAARAAICRAVDEAPDRARRARFLDAYVEIQLVAGELQAARDGAAELGETAEQIASPTLTAVGARARAAVALADGDALAALSDLRRAWTAWQELEAPFECARVRVLIGLACRLLDDDDGAELEWEAARTVFDKLGATPALAHVSALLRPAEVTSVLSARELEVLRLLAAAMTNRSIATELTISEKTVARHVSNIFAKLGMTSRAAATAYAYKHGFA